MSALRGFAAVLLPDDCSRRAITETMADWREDVAGSTSFARTIRAHARGVASLVHLAASLVLDQFTSFNLWRTFGMTVVVASAGALVMAAVATWVLYGGGRPPFATISASAFALMSFSTAVLSWFATTSAMGLGRTSDRPAPVLGMLVLCFVFSVVVANWMVPVMSGMYVRGVLRMLPPDTVVSRSTVSVAIQYASLLFASTYFLLGETIRRRLHGRGWRTRQAVALGGVLFIVSLGFAARTIISGYAVVSGEDSLLWREASMWAQLAIAWIVILAMSRSLTRGRSSIPTVVAD